LHEGDTAPVPLRINLRTDVLLQRLRLNRVDVAPHGRDLGLHVSFCQDRLDASPGCRNALEQDVSAHLDRANGGDRDLTEIVQRTAEILANDERTQTAIRG